MKTKLLIFGITGDLSTRKLLPALRGIVATGKYDDLQIIGVSRREVDVAELLQKSLGDDTLVSRTSMFVMDVARREEYVRLAKHVNMQPDEQLLVYLSVPPSAATQIVEHMGEVGINTPNVRILFEKPFGVDYESARDMIDRAARYYSDEQLYRIDHYAAKEIAVALRKLRTSSEGRHHGWGSESIASIEILATETIGIEGRVDFYEQTGALRDFVQGHLMQLLALILMDPNTADVRQARRDALAQVKPANPENTLRAQYDGYDTEAGNPGSQIETFVQIGLESGDQHWRGVPMTLLTGKALDKKRSQIVILYRDGLKEVFDEMTVSQMAAEALDAYERVLIEAIEGRKDLFTSSDEVLESWRILMPLLDAWAVNKTPLIHYPVGAHPDTIR